MDSHNFGRRLCKTQVRERMPDFVLCQDARPLQEEGSSRQTHSSYNRSPWEKALYSGYTADIRSSLHQTIIQRILGLAQKSVNGVWHLQNLRLVVLFNIRELCGCHYPSPS